MLPDGLNGFVGKFGWNGEYLVCDIARKLWPRLRRMNYKMVPDIIETLELDPVPMALEDTILWKKIAEELASHVWVWQSQRHFHDNPTLDNIESWPRIELSALHGKLETICDRFDIPKVPFKALWEHCREIPIGTGWSDRVIQLATAWALDVGPAW